MLRWSVGSQTKVQTGKDRNRTKSRYIGQLGRNFYLYKHGFIPGLPKDSRPFTFAFSRDLPFLLSLCLIAFICAKRRQFSASGSVEASAGP